MARQQTQRNRMSFGVVLLVCLYSSIGSAQDRRGHFPPPIAERFTTIDHLIARRNSCGAPQNAVSLSALRRNVRRSVEAITRLRTLANRIEGRNADAANQLRERASELETQVLGVLDQTILLVSQETDRACQPVSNTSR